MNDKQQTDTRPMPPFDMDPSILESLNGPTSMGALVPVKSGETLINVNGELVTAQKVAVERDLGKIMGRIKVLAAGAGMRWFYRIPFKNRQKGTTEYVEGLTIKGANAVVREYGNCLVTQRVQDMGTHWVIYARFVDLERGTTYDRPFMQRKGQDTGMGDAERRADLVFQIGVSKATRNVLVNALEDLCTYAFDEARSGLQQRIDKNPDGAKKWILDKLVELKIDVKRVSAIYGRTPDHWLVPDMAKIYAEINTIEEGMALAEEVYPTIEAPDKKNESGKQPGAKEGEKTKSGEAGNPKTPVPPPANEESAAQVPEGEVSQAGQSGDAAATSRGSSPAAAASPKHITFAKVIDALNKADSAEQFDFARNMAKGLPDDQAAEINVLASKLYAEKFKKKDDDAFPLAKAAAPKPAAKPAPPLFG